MTWINYDVKAKSRSFLIGRLSLIRKQVDKKPGLNENKQKKMPQKRKTLLVKSLIPSITMVYNNV